MRWLFAALALMTGFGAAIQLPHLTQPVNAVLFVILTVQTVVYAAIAIVSWIEDY